MHKDFSNLAYNNIKEILNIFYLYYFLRLINVK